MRKILAIIILLGAGYAGYVYFLRKPKPKEAGRSTFVPLPRIVEKKPETSPEPVPWTTSETPAGPSKPIELPAFLSKAWETVRGISGVSKPKTEPISEPSELKYLDQYTPRLTTPEIPEERKIYKPEFTLTLPEPEPAREPEPAYSGALSQEELYDYYLKIGEMEGW